MSTRPEGMDATQTTSVAAVQASYRYNTFFFIFPPKFQKYLYFDNFYPKYCFYIPTISADTDVVKQVIPNLDFLIKQIL